MEKSGNSSSPVREQAEQSTAGKQPVDGNNNPQRSDSRASNAGQDFQPDCSENNGGGNLLGNLLGSLEVNKPVYEANASLASNVELSVVNEVTIENCDFPIQIDYMSTADGLDSVAAEGQRQQQPEPVFEREEANSDREEFRVENRAYQVIGTDYQQIDTDCYVEVDQNLITACMPDLVDTSTSEPRVELEASIGQLDDGRQASAPLHEDSESPTADLLLESAETYRSLNLNQTSFLVLEQTNEEATAEVMNCEKESESTMVQSASANTRKSRRQADRRSESRTADEEEHQPVTQPSKDAKDQNESATTQSDSAGDQRPSSSPDQSSIAPAPGTTDSSLTQNEPDHELSGRSNSTKKRAPKSPRIVEQPPPVELTPTRPASGRPQRQRKMPALFAGNDFEIEDSIKRRLSSSSKTGANNEKVIQKSTPTKKIDDEVAAAQNDVKTTPIRDDGRAAKPKEKPLILGKKTVVIPITFDQTTKQDQPEVEQSKADSLKAEQPTVEQQADKEAVKEDDRKAAEDQPLNGNQLDRQTDEESKKTDEAEDPQQTAAAAAQDTQKIETAEPESRTEENEMQIEEPSKETKQTTKNEKNVEVQEEEQQALEEGEDHLCREQDKAMQADKDTQNDAVSNEKQSEEEQPSAEEELTAVKEEAVKEKRPSEPEAKEPAAKEDSANSDESSPAKENDDELAKENEAWSKQSLDKEQQSSESVESEKAERSSFSASDSEEEERLKIDEKLASDHKQTKRPQAATLRNDSVASSKPKRTAVRSAVARRKPPSSDEEEDEEDDEEWESDREDPNKLWCICRKPYGNKFMIECESCKEWFHGRCVGITQTAAKQYEDPKRKWYCKKCREAQQNDRKLLPDKKSTPPKPAIKGKTKPPLLPHSVPKQRPPISTLKKEDKKRKSLETEELQKRILLDQAELKKRFSLGARQKERQSLESNDARSPKDRRRKLSLADLEQYHPVPAEKRPKPDKYVERISERTSEKLSEHLRSSPEPLGNKHKAKAIVRSNSTSGGDAEDDEKRRLKKLIKSKQADLTRKLSITSNDLPSSRPEAKGSPPSVDRSSSLESTTNQDKPAPVGSSKSELKEQQQAKASKKKSFSSEDPSIGDLFKPIIMQKKIPTVVKRLNSSENASPTQSNCALAGCHRSAQRLNDKDSVYCSKECIERYVASQIPIVKKIKLSNALSGAERKSISEDDRKVALVDKKTGKYLSGNSAIEESRILAFVLANPSYEIQLPARKPSTNADPATPSSTTKKHAKTANVSSSAGKEVAAPTDSRKPAKSGEGSEDLRETVALQLRRALNARLENCQDLQIVEPGTTVKQIANRIERKLFDLFKEPNKNYKNRFRSLLFNLKDPKNEGLFKKVLSGKLEADRLVRMSSEELASPELAKWRERENRHSIEMIKKDAEAQAIQIVVKKTHKGEEVIKQSAAQIPVLEEIKKVESGAREEAETKGPAAGPDAKSETKPAKIVSAKNARLGSSALDLLFKDTTEEHGRHAFDLHCKICLKQTREDLSLVNRPKPLSEFEKNRLKEAEELEKRAAAELNNIDKLLSADSSNSSSSNTDARPVVPGAAATASDPAPPRTVHSCWNGYLYTQESPKFIAFAYKVGGMFETQDILDSIQIRGRIAPEQVYYYLDEIKQSRNEITLLKFIPANDTEKVSYEAYFDYLHKRNRFGVVTNLGRTIKDFYIFPLASDQDPHPSLLQFNGICFEEKRARPNYLLGLLVKKSKHTAPMNHQHSKSELHVERSSSHYSPNLGSRAKAAVAGPLASGGATTPPSRAELKSQQKRSYTPPPPAAASQSSDNHQPVASGSENSNSMDDVSYTPPRKDKYQDEPYDPEEGLDFKSIKRQKKEHQAYRRSNRGEGAEREALNRSGSAEAPAAAKHASPTKNLANLLEYLSKTGKLCEKGSTSIILNEIAKISSSEEQQLLLKEFRRKVEESERHLEIKRRAAENAFSQAAASSSNNFDSNCIPGLDGDFSSLTDAKAAEEESSLLGGSLLTPNDLEIPDSWKEIIEKYSSTQETSNILNDPIVKNYGGSESSKYDDQANDEPEPMELDDEEETNTNTIIEVNHPTKPSAELASVGADEELLLKAKLQLDYLKQMEKEQEKLVAGQRKSPN